MVRRVARISIDRHKSHNYKQVADNLYEGALVAKEFEYWNAAGPLIVHAAIAYTDAITIKLAGVKSRGQDHDDTVAYD